MLMPIAGLRYCSLFDYSSMYTIPLDERIVKPMKSRAVVQSFYPGSDEVAWACLLRVCNSDKELSFKVSYSS